MANFGRKETISSFFYRRFPLIFDRFCDKDNFQYCVSNSNAKLCGNRFGLNCRPTGIKVHKCDFDLNMWKFTLNQLDFLSNVRWKTLETNLQIFIGFFEASKYI